MCCKCRLWDLASGATLGEFTTDFHSAPEMYEKFSLAQLPDWAKQALSGSEPWTVVGNRHDSKPPLEAAWAEFADRHELLRVDETRKKSVLVRVYRPMLPAQQASLQQAAVQASGSQGTLETSLPTVFALTPAHDISDQWVLANPQGTSIALSTEDMKILVYELPS